MAFLNIPDSLTPVEVRYKEMYCFYKNEGIDISLPLGMKDINDLFHKYLQVTGIDLAYFHAAAAFVPDTPVIIEEAAAFAYKNDVDVYIHNRYFPIPVHSHEYYEIMCNIKGNCIVYFDDTSVPLQTGDTLIIPPNVIHTISVFNDDCILYNNEIRFSTLRDKFSNLFFSRNIISDLFNRSFTTASCPSFIIFHTGDYYLGNNKLGDIVAEFNSNSDYSSEVANLLTSAFLFDLLRHYSKAATISTIQSKDKIDVLLMEYIIEHANTVTLDELSRKFSYSDRHIARIVKKNAGLAYSQLIRKIKMDNIAKLVACSSLPIEKIIEMSGVSSPSYFYKSFKQYFGKTPLEYRSEMLDEYEKN